MKTTGISRHAHEGLETIPVGILLAQSYVQDEYLVPSARVKHLKFYSLIEWRLALRKPRCVGMPIEDHKQTLHEGQTVFLSSLQRSSRGDKMMVRKLLAKDNSIISLKHMQLLSCKSKMIIIIRSAFPATYNNISFR